MRPDSIIIIGLCIGGMASGWLMGQLNPAGFVFFASLMIILEVEKKRRSEKAMTIADSRIKGILKPKAYMEFTRWMGGQTAELHNGTIHIFEDDFLRWVKQQKAVD